MGIHRRNNFDEYIGKTFNNLKVISYYGYRQRNHYFKCLCKCGNELVLQFGVIGKTKRCKRCVEVLPEEYIGTEYGKLTIIKYAGATSYLTKRNTYQKNHYYLCKCECGNKKKIYIGNLKSGKSKSCGCMPYSTKYSKIEDKSLMGIWTGMINRCYNPNNKGYKDYGGRGIIVCERWINSFENFSKDMLPRPSNKHSIDRKNNDGNYEPSNCHWATRKQQANNTRLSNVITQIKLARATELSRERIRQIWRTKLIQFVDYYVGKSPVFNKKAIDFIKNGHHKKSFAH